MSDETKSFIMPPETINSLNLKDGPSNIRGRAPTEIPGGSQVSVRPVPEVVKNVFDRIAFVEWTLMWSNVFK
ncbi:hypothetical protein QQF64_029837 [Cirrhinus molitorella]|uniref:Uncharacterized protein n=1 Tax=Cirrhinus molitorella TaxID=172907 RepID=A0ABR3N1R8_9TELE